MLSNVTVTNVRPAGLTLIAGERQPEGVCNALRLHNVHVHFRKMESTKEEEASEVKQTTKQSKATRTAHPLYMYMCSMCSVLCVEVYLVLYMYILER